MNRVQSAIAEARCVIALGTRVQSDPEIMTALDADGDGELSAKEIERSSASLASIDKDGNGSLTADELRPDFGRMFGGPSAAKPG